MSSTPAPYTPAPGTEYPFSVSDIAYATAALLGNSWSAESGHWGVTGVLSGPCATSFVFTVDYEGDLCIQYDRFEADALPDSPNLPLGVQAWAEGVYLEDASAVDGLDDVALLSADAISAVLGQLDTESPASRQHYILTGRFLRQGEAAPA
ncbi:hypothetical protein OHA46_34120 (plasmid) [Streptomyces sp. NBC_00708]